MALLEVIDLTKDFGGVVANSHISFEIEKGEIVGRVKDVSIAGNVYEVLKDVDAVSRESRWVYNRARLPYLLLPDMNVIARQQ